MRQKGVLLDHQKGRGFTLGGVLTSKEEGKKLLELSYRKGTKRKSRLQHKRYFWDKVFDRSRVKIDISSKVALK